MNVLLLMAALCKQGCLFLCVQYFAASLGCRKHGIERAGGVQSPKVLLWTAEGACMGGALPSGSTGLAGATGFVQAFARVQ